MDEKRQEKTVRHVLFILSMPVYWYIIFTYILHWFDEGVFLAVILSSSLLSVLGLDWGILGLRDQHTRNQDGGSSASPQPSADYEPSPS